jgi:uncharacterized protein YjbI with pentapeptide repeats
MDRSTITARALISDLVEEVFSCGILAFGTTGRDAALIPAVAVTGGFGAVIDGAVIDGAATDGAATDGAVVDGAVVDGAVVDGAVTDGAVTDGAVVDGAVIDGAVIDGAVIDGAATDGAATDGAVTDGAVTDGAVTDGAVVDGAVVDGAVVDGAAIEASSPVTSTGGLGAADDGAVAGCGLAALFGVEFGSLAGMRITWPGRSAVGLASGLAAINDSTETRYFLAMLTNISPC